MNKIYGIIAIFAFAGLLLPTSAIQIDAASDLDYMLTIAEKGKKYIKIKIKLIIAKDFSHYYNTWLIFFSSYFYCTGSSLKFFSLILLKSSYSYLFY